jgi:glycolate oxidase iron-sulfur subunit
MQTALADFIRDTPAGTEAEEILRKCVHCGFCTATCPTYQLLGDELDGPRGRIYLIKQMLESGTASERTRLHLDRCLTCRACETTCPSGVHYSRLLDIGRAVVEQRAPRSGIDALMRSLLKTILPRPALFNPAMKLGQTVRGLLPAALKAKVPAAQSAGTWPPPRHVRHMIALAGCVQPAMAPNINAATARVLDRIGISLIVAERAGCCGALRFHLNEIEAAQDDARRNIDAWWPLLAGSAEALVMTASGCGVQVRDYAHLLQDDARYAAKAARVALLTLDAGEALAAESERLLPLLEQTCRDKPRTPVAFHSPCTLQHGQKVRGVVENLLTAAGFDLVPVADAHLCCGSAGTYSVLQAELSTRLRDNKLAALASGRPAAIASANIGCITHLQSGTQLPVRHWIELIDERLS